MKLFRGYIKEVKDDSNNSGDVGKIAYQLAVRYHIDIGQRSLMRGHFATMDQVCHIGCSLRFTCRGLIF
jgi:hypothetical protein